MTAMIKVSNLGKRYTIRHNQPRRRGYRRLSEDLVGALTWPARKFRTATTPSSNGQVASLTKCEEFWALSEVDFEVQQGDVVGIIGRNGAGKSTLLKLLSRITEPTTGRIELHGRVASLLEVGTGFHPELTGRENIFLNGAILGMTRAEIKRKFDEIVAFAEVEKFLDTPVKRYSSGMHVRLAFAVAAHLEPEILLVDEVLAVGDAEFQKKCLGKMEDVSRGGRTVLFVSHNMGAVSNLCGKGIVLDRGRTDFHGEVDVAVRHYLARLGGHANYDLSSRTDRQGSGGLRFERVQITDAFGNPCAAVRSGDTIEIRIAYRNYQKTVLDGVVFAVPFDSLLSGRMFVCQTNLTGQSARCTAGNGEIVLRIPRLPLAAGTYTCNLWCSLKAVKGEVLDWVKQAFTLDVEPGDFFGNGELPTGGAILVDHEWLNPSETLITEHTPESASAIASGEL
jgi:lipopolysaccharide transport system ATP-binding protein